jgi:anhydro-N-acetylmuramic acid kinase
MHYIGLMSGTSADAIDAALVEIAVNQPIRLLATRAHPIAPDTRAALEALMTSGDNEIDRAGELDVALGEMFAEAAVTLLTDAGIRAQEVRAIGSHGQTIRHRPGARFPFTRQIGNPSTIAERTGITTVADFRARDMAAGGQGAPLAPAFHDWAFRSRAAARAIVNIGGIANVTLLPADAARAPTGFDTGPGNTLLDQWIRRHHGCDFDRDGAWAASGRVHQDLLAALLADPYFRTPPPQSSGREHFNLPWLDRILATGFEQVDPVDVQATLTHLTARAIADAVTHYGAEAAEIYACGGGSHNRALLQALRDHLPDRRIDTTAALGVHPDWVEASAFAWLAHQTLLGQPGNLPSVTGARRPVILGGIYAA